jgi:hypothetical protein
MHKHIRYGREMALGFFAYGLGIVALNFGHIENSNLNLWLILLPCIPILYITSVIIRFVSELDEMQRKIVIEAMAFAGLSTGFTCFSYLFARDLGAPEFRAEWAFYAMVFFYGVGMLWSAKRYR